MTNIMGRDVVKTSLSLIKEKIIKTDTVLNIVSEKNATIAQLQAKLDLISAKFIEKGKDSRVLKELCDSKSKRNYSLTSRLVQLQELNDRIIFDSNSAETQNNERNTTNFLTIQNLGTEVNKLNDLVAELKAEIALLKGENGANANYEANEVGIFKVTVNDLKGRILFLENDVNLKKRLNYLCQKNLLTSRAEYKKLDSIFNNYKNNCERKTIEKCSKCTQNITSKIEASSLTSNIDVKKENYYKLHCEFEELKLSVNKLKNDNVDITEKYSNLLLNQGSVKKILVSSQTEIEKNQIDENISLKSEKLQLKEDLAKAARKKKILQGDFNYLSEDYNKIHDKYEALLFENEIMLMKNESKSNLVSIETQTCEFLQENSTNFDDLVLNLSSDSDSEKKSQFCEDILEKMITLPIRISSKKIAKIKNQLPEIEITPVSAIGNIDFRTDEPAQAIKWHSEIEITPLRALGNIDFRTCASAKTIFDSTKKSREFDAIFDGEGNLIKGLADENVNLKRKNVVKNRKKRLRKDDRKIRNQRSNDLRTKFTMEAKIIDVNERNLSSLNIKNTPLICTAPSVDSKNNNSVDFDSGYTDGSVLSESNTKENKSIEKVVLCRFFKRKNSDASPKANLMHKRRKVKSKQSFIEEMSNENGGKVDLISREEIHKLTVNKEHLIRRFMSDLPIKKVEKTVFKKSLAQRKINPPIVCGNDLLAFTKNILENVGDNEVTSKESTEEEVNSSIDKNEISDDDGRKLLNRLIQFNCEESVISDVCERLKPASTKQITRLIIHSVYKFRCEAAQPSHTPLAPDLSPMYKTLIGFANILSEERPDIFTELSNQLEIQFLLQNNGNIIKNTNVADGVVPTYSVMSLEQVYRFYVSLCKLRADWLRLRRFLCDMAFYQRDGWYALMYAAFTVWPAVLPKRFDEDNKITLKENDALLMKLLMFFIFKKRNSDEYMYYCPFLTSFAFGYYKYTSESLHIKTIFDELVEKFTTSDSNIIAFAIVILLQRVTNTDLMNLLRSESFNNVFKAPDEVALIGKSKLLWLLDKIIPEIKRRGDAAIIRSLQSVLEKLQTQVENGNVKKFIQSCMGKLTN